MQDSGRNRRRLCQPLFSSFVETAMQIAAFIFFLSELLRSGGPRLLAAEKLIATDGGASYGGFPFSRSLSSIG